MIQKMIIRGIYWMMIMQLAPILPHELKAIEHVTITKGNWEMAYDDNSHNIDFSYKGIPILNQTFVKAKDSRNQLFYSNQADQVFYQTESIQDQFGTGEKISFLYKQSGKPDIVRCFYFYAHIPNGFFLESKLECDSVIHSNYIVPLTTETTSTFLPSTSSANRVLVVPFSNDNWTRYKTAEMKSTATSYHVTAIYDGVSRNGLVMGAVEFDTWKFAIQTTTLAGFGLKSLDCICGIANSQTDDGRATPAITRHGAVQGKTLKSSKIFVGFFDDWRKGLEYYGEAVAQITPPRKWEKKSLFGWNSWGAMAEKVNYEGVMDVVDYLKEHIQPVFHDQDSSLYVILDSYWDNLSQFQLRSFSATCKRQGLHPGIYWSPFCDWHGYSDGEIGNQQMDGSNYTFRDAMICYNGVPVRLHNAWALDPTHPGTRARMKYQIEKFKSLGFEYVKVDFLNNGMLEGDSFYDPTVTTGMQAYNQGMAYLSELCGEDMFIDLSIAPTFPSQYGNARRISCDAWGNISSSEMVINCLSYGWWLDRVYRFNDPDHAVFYKFSPEENRVRMTSEVITGKCLLGDNFSLSGSYCGSQAVRSQAETVILNPEIVQIGQMGLSFWPIYGYNSQSGQGENLLMMENDTVTYLVAFNYSSQLRYFEVPFEDIHLTNQDITSIKELWSGRQITKPKIEDLDFSVDSKDVKIFQIKKNSASTSISNPIEKQDISVIQENDRFILSSQYGLKHLNIYNCQGLLIWHAPLKTEKTAKIALPGLTKGIFIANIDDIRGNRLKYKFFNH